MKGWEGTQAWHPAELLLLACFLRACRSPPQTDPSPGNPAPSPQLLPLGSGSAYRSLGQEPEKAGGDQEASLDPCP